MSDHRIIPIDRGLVSCSCGQWRQYVAPSMKKLHAAHVERYEGRACDPINGTHVTPHVGCILR
jgi:hypothetical protein